MNRRNFLRGLFGVAAAAAVAPVMKFIPEHPQAAPGVTAVKITHYADYISLSDSAIDPVVTEIAKELAYRAALTVDETILNQLAASPTFAAELRKAGLQVDHRKLARFKRAIRRERYNARQYRRRARAVCIQR